MWRMIVVKLQELADKNKVSLYRISKDTGIAYSTLHKMKQNKAKTLDLNVIAKLCDYLKCKPGDLIETN